MIYQLLFWLKDFFRGTSFGGLRSSQWSKVRAEYLKKNPRCEVCGKEGGLLKPLNVHHCKVFHLHPELELDPNNLITLCREHHLLFGHYMSWKSWAEDVRETSKLWKNKIAQRP